MNVGVMGCGVISRAYVENASGVRVLRARRLRRSRSRAGERARQGQRPRRRERRRADRRSGDRRDPQPHAAARARRGHARRRSRPASTSTPRSRSRSTRPRRARSRAEAERLGLRIGCAPDIFLGSAYQAGRAAIDEGAIGDPLAVSAAMLVGGQETWHPNPDIFYADGAGPLFDMGPYYLTAIVALLGPITSVAGFASTRTRRAHDRDRAAHRRALPGDDADPHDSGDAARERRHGEPRRELRGPRPVHLRRRDPRQRGRARAARPERLRRRRAHQARPRRLGGRALRLARRRRRARHRPARHGRGDRGRPAASRVRRSSARTSSRSRAASCTSADGGPHRRDRVARRAAAAAARSTAWPEPGRSPQARALDRPRARAHPDAIGAQVLLEHRAQVRLDRGTVPLRLLGRVPEDPAAGPIESWNAIASSTLDPTRTTASVRSKLTPE